MKSLNKINYKGGRKKQFKKSSRKQFKKSSRKQFKKSSRKQFKKSRRNHLNIYYGKGGSDEPVGSQTNPIELIMDDGGDRYWVMRTYRETKAHPSKEKYTNPLFILEKLKVTSRQREDEKSDIAFGWRERIERAKESEEERRKALDGESFYIPGETGGNYYRLMWKSGANYTLRNETPEVLNYLAKLGFQLAATELTKRAANIKAFEREKKKKLNDLYEFCKENCEGAKPDCEAARANLHRKGAATPILLDDVTHPELKEKCDLILFRPDSGK